MTTFNKFKKFMNIIKDVGCIKLNDIFDKVKTYRSKSGNIVIATKTEMNIGKDIKTLKNSGGLNFKDMITVVKDNVIAILT
jgi:hypothetical protein